MTTYQKEILQSLTYMLGICALLWFGFSTIVQALSCPEMTQTELLLNIPDSIRGVWDCE